MRVHLERFGFGIDSTLGKLYVPGELRPCYTLEDEIRPKKVHGETAVWEGVYPLELRTEGRMHKDYSQRFPKMHKGMIWIRDIVDFTYCYVHILNREDQTEGCVGVGEQPAVDSHGEFSVISSTAAYKRIYPPIARALEQGEECSIRITRRTMEVAA